MTEDESPKRKRIALTSPRARVLFWSVLTVILGIEFWNIVLRPVVVSHDRVGRARSYVARMEPQLAADARFGRVRLSAATNEKDGVQYGFVWVTGMVSTEADAGELKRKIEATKPAVTVTYACYAGPWPPPEPDPKSLQWGGLNLDSAMLDLQSDTDVQWMLFHRDGSVSLSIGKKHGSITGPLCYWKVAGERLQVFDDGGVWVQMRPIKKEGKTLWTENARGQTEVYRIGPKDEPVAEEKK